MSEQKFKTSNIYEMPNIASVLLEKLELDSLADVWSRIQLLDGKPINLFLKTVELQIKGENISYDGQDDDGYFAGGPALEREEFDMIATNLPYCKEITYGDLFALCESRAYCKGAKCCPEKLVLNLSLNLGQTVLTKISIVYGLTFYLLS